MRSFTQVSRWLHVVVATLAVWSQGRVHELFERLNIGNYWLVGTVFIVMIGIQASDHLSNLAVDRARWLRRLILGQDDIEGDWVSIVVNTTEPDKIIAAEYSRICYRSGTFMLSGDTWSLDGKWMGDYSTTGGATFQGRRLEYYYKTGIKRIGGFGVMLFLPSYGVVTSSICRYLDETIKSPWATSSHRISTKLRHVSMDDRRAAALRFAREFDQKGLLDLRAALGGPAP